MDVEQAKKLIVDECVFLLRPLSEVAGRVPKNALESAFYITLEQPIFPKLLEAKRSLYLSQLSQNPDSEKAWAKVIELIRKDLAEQLPLPDDSPEPIHEGFPDPTESGVDQSSFFHDLNHLDPDAEGVDDTERGFLTSDNIMENYAEALAPEEEKEESTPPIASPLPDDEIKAEGECCILPITEIGQLAEDMAEMGNTSPIPDLNHTPTPLTKNVPPSPKKKKKDEETDLFEQAMYNALRKIESAAKEALRMQTKAPLRNVLTSGLSNLEKNIPELCFIAKRARLFLEDKGGKRSSASKLLTFIDEIRHFMKGKANIWEKFQEFKERTAQREREENELLQIQQSGKKRAAEIQKRTAQKKARKVRSTKKKEEKERKKKASRLGALSGSDSEKKQEKEKTYR